MIKKAIVFSLIVATICFCGCINIGNDTNVPSHDENDKIYVNYMPNGYYYFEDDNGRSFNKTLWEGDVSELVKGHTVNSWIDFVHSLEYMEDENDQEIFYNITEVLERGGGDCEDLAILMARGIHELGYNSSVIVQKSHVLAGLSKDDMLDDSNHIEFRLANHKRKTFTWILADNYFAIECTVPWEIGEYDESPLKYEKIYMLN